MLFKAKYSSLISGKGYKAKMFYILYETLVSVYCTSVISDTKVSHPNPNSKLHLSKSVGAHVKTIPWLLFVLIPMDMLVYLGMIS